MNIPEDQLRAKLTPEQYKVVHDKGTEAPFSGEFDDFFETGVYKCVACGETLFTSDSKYDAGCGWPSFWDAVDHSKVKLIPDNTFGMRRTEVQCGNCGGHLGHVFEDGPAAHGGQRYCINSASLAFDPAKGPRTA